MANNYYWRAVRRIAEKRNISITKARRMDWEKEANAERKRRSKAARLVWKTRKPSKPKRTSKRSIPVPGTKYKRTHTDTIPKRVPGHRKPSPVPSSRPAPELIEEEEELFEEGTDEEFEDEWESDWKEDYPELDDLDNLDDFLESFEYEDDDKYKEPS
jgi:hypothetical protein